MGIYDRDYERGYGNTGGWRPEGEGGIQLRWPSTTVGWVLLVTFVAYLIELPFTERPPGGVPTNAVADALGLQSDWWRRPWLAYGLLTYGFMHSALDFFHILGNMWMFWIFGRELEARYGSREFLAFYLVAIVAGGLAFTLGQTIAGEPGSVIGASGGSVAVLVLGALLFPHRQVLFMFVFPMPLWVLGAFVVGSDILGSLGAGPMPRAEEANVAFAAHLGGAAFAFAYYRRRWRLSGLLPERLQMPSFQRRPKLRVHQGDDYDDYQDQPAKESAEEKLAKEVDRILAKIQISGQDSLTRKETKTLEQASRQARDRRR
ncbi:MAG: rhomboid family intramembrane serine protease [Planctomycetota bacterium]